MTTFIYTKEGEEEEERTDKRLAYDANIPVIPGRQVAFNIQTEIWCEHIRLIPASHKAGFPEQLHHLLHTTSRHLS